MSNALFTPVRQRLTDWLSRRPVAVSSMRLQQRQIYIVPTLTGLAYAGVLVLMLLVAINYQNSLAYGLTFLLASLGLLSMFHTWRNLAGLTVAAAGSAPCFAGENGSYRVRLTSAKNAYQAIGIGWHKQQLQLLDIASQTEQHVELTAQGLQRGWQPAPRVRIETRFPLGLFVAWSQIRLAQSMLVYPQPLYDEVLNTLGQGDEQDSEQTTLLAGVDDYQGLNPWQPGDSLNRIHWKAWSKGQGLLVKHFAEQQGRQQVLDFAQLTGHEEYRLSVLCAQVLTISQSDQPYSLYLPGQQIGPGVGEEHRQQCLHALAVYGVKP